MRWYCHRLASPCSSLFPIHNLLTTTKWLSRLIIQFMVSYLFLLSSPWVWFAGFSSARRFWFAVLVFLLNTFITAGLQTVTFSALSAGFIALFFQSHLVWRDGYDIRRTCRRSYCSPYVGECWFEIWRGHRLNRCFSSFLSLSWNIPEINWVALNSSSVILPFDNM